RVRSRQRDPHDVHRGGRRADRRARRGRREARPHAAAVLGRRPRRAGATPRRLRPERCREPLEGAASRQPGRGAAAPAGGRVDLASATEVLAASVATAEAVVPVGARTQWHVGNPPAAATEIRAPAGIAAYEPDDLTVTVGAGTTCAALDAALAAHGQECP